MQLLDKPQNCRTEQTEEAYGGHAQFAAGDLECLACKQSLSTHDGARDLLREDTTSMLAPATAAGPAFGSELSTKPTQNLQIRVRLSAMSNSSRASLSKLRGDARVAICTHSPTLKWRAPWRTEGCARLIGGTWASHHHRRCHNRCWSLRLTSLINNDPAIWCGKPRELEQELMNPYLEQNDLTSTSATDMPNDHNPRGPLHTS